jgi:hypothetical protein
MKASKVGSCILKALQVQSLTFQCSITLLSAPDDCGVAPSLPGDAQAQARVIEQLCLTLEGMNAELVRSKAASKKKLPTINTNVFKEIADSVHGMSAILTAVGVESQAVIQNQDFQEHLQAYHKHVMQPLVGGASLSRHRALEAPDQSITMTAMALATYSSKMVFRCLFQHACRFNARYESCS